MEFKIKLVETCGACPEQYDAFHSITGEKIGYLRLRHGYFRAEYNRKVVYDAYPDGDGCFESQEREHYLREACDAIRKAHLEKISKENEGDRSYYF